MFDAASLEKMLYQRAGLLGLSGISGDMRVLQESKDPHAVAAIAHFVYTMTKYAGAYAAVLDAFVFTAGIGENSVPIRAALCAKMRSLGVKLDERANAVGGPRISSMDSKVSVWVIPTNEELMIAQHTLALLRPRLDGGKLARRLSIDHAENPPYNALSLGSSG
ncbi:MAG: hypothetical protein WAK01_07575 [Methylocystis sp.]